MEAVFDSLVFGLGLLLGVFAPEADPAIALRAYRDVGAVYASADLRDAAGPGLRRLAEAGEPVGVELTIFLRSGSLERRRSWTRTVRRDPASGVYTVRRSEDGKEFATPVRDAAFELLFRFTGLTVALVEELESGVELKATARLFFPDSVDDAPNPQALWNYRRPAAEAAYAAFAELPR